MGMVAILVFRLVLIKQIFNQLLLGGCIRNLIEICPAVSEEKWFENDEKWVKVN